jgi:hypothetical protein
MQHNQQPQIPVPLPPAPAVPVTVTRFGGLRVQTGLKPGLGWSGIFFGGVSYPR